MGQITDREGLSTPKVRVLLITANPADTSRLAIGEEHREIIRRLRVSDLREAFEVQPAPQIRLDEVAAELQRVKPAVVHFSGHGSTDGELLLVGATGAAEPADPDALAKIFEVLSRETPVRCVVLHACFSDALAARLTPFVDCVIGVPAALKDTLAISFAGAFYQALGFGRSVRAAFDLAVAEVQLLSPDTPAPQTLRARPEIALDALRLIDDATAVRALTPRPDDAELAALSTLLTAAAIPLDRCAAALVASDPTAPAAATATLDAMLRHLAGFSTAAPVPRLADFAQRLALTEFAARDALLAWAEKHTARHGGDPAALAAHWTSLDDPSLGRHCLMIVLDEDEGGRFNLRAWVGRERATPVAVFTSEAPVTADKLVEAVDEVLSADAMFALLVATQGARLLVELIVPLRDLVLVTAKAFAEAPFAAEHDVVVRWRERVYARTKRPPRGMRAGIWQRKWERVEKGTASWTPPSDDALSRDECGAVTLSPVDDRAAWLATLERTLMLGLPVVAWISDGAPVTDAKPLFARLTEVTPAEALARAVAARTDAKSPDARYLCLLWDDPSRLPPDAMPAAQFAAPTPR